MSTGPIGIVSSAAGAPGAARQSDNEKAKADRAQQSARADQDRFALRRDETVDETQLGQGAVSDRDADGRLLSPPERQKNEDAEPDDSERITSPPPAEDGPGSNLDLMA
jgi:hypothetical protein